jgi:putative nucleotidyltransferase with HDIG domain
MPKTIDLPTDLFAPIQKMAAERNTPCYVVGGYVRDLLLGRNNKDIDVLVIGGGIEFAQALSTQLPGKPPVAIFKSYGTAMIRLPDLELEFVGARKESYRLDSRKPLVEDGSLEDDLARRDFTINAMAIELFPHYGNLVDLYQGETDLENRRLITPLEPNITFSDDPLRMMRAIRFATQLQFTIDPVTLRAIKANAERLEIVSMERIADELNKIILAPKPSIGFRLLFDTGILNLIFPEMAALHGVKTIDGFSHKDNFYHTLKVLDNISIFTDDLWLRWSAILHDIAKPPTQRFEPKIGWTFHGHEELGAKMVPKIFRRLKLPLHEEMRRVQKLVKLHLRPIALTKTVVTDSAVRRLIFEVGEDIDSLMKLCRADITSKNELKVQRYLQNFVILEEKLQAVVASDRVRLWQPPISGNDIMNCFGIRASREVGIIKNTIKDAILAGEIENDKTQAWELMIKKGKQLGLTQS